MPFTVSQRTRAIGIPTAPGAGGISGIGTIARRDTLQFGVGAIGSVVEA